MTVPGNLSSPLLATAADAAAAGANITKSLRFNSGDSANLHRTPSSAGNRKTWTFAAWIKLSDVGTSDRQVFSCRVSGTAQIQIGQSGSALIGFNEYGIFDLRTSRLMRDPGAWFHLCCVFDSSNSTEGDRARIYVNGVRETDFSTETYPSQNAEASWNRTERHNIGSLQPSYDNYFDGYMADIYFIDGSALDPVNNFIEADSNGVYQVKAYTGTYGTNGFHLLDFANESTIGHDSSGNENDFTAVNFSTTAGAGNDVLFDVPTNGSQSDGGNGGEVSGNYCTWNPLVGRYNDSGQSGPAPSFSNGNLNVSGGQTNDRIAGTFHFNVGQSGKYYWEVTFTGTPASSNGAGVRDYSAGTATQVLRLWYYSASTVDGGPATSFTTGDVLGFAMDLSAETIDCYKNGGSSVGQMDISSLTSVTPFVSTNSGVGVVGNFGQRAFAHSAPSGFKALCTANLPTPTIADGSTAFDAKLWTGDGSSSRAITGYNFSPDFVWIKTRSETYGHAIFDIVRGANIRLDSVGTNADQTITDGLHSFDSNGFTIGNRNTVGENTETYVGWAWDGGTSTVSNTDGDITSNVRANASAGFSIVSYTGSGTSNDSVGHGLNAAPELIITKNRDGAYSWRVLTTVIDGSLDRLFLDATNAKADQSGVDVPTSSVFSVGSNLDHNKSGDDIIAYCFAPVAGFSSFGSYAGNGSSNGPFVYTGFKPAFVMTKSSSTASTDWMIFDYKRPEYNVTDGDLRANLSNAEASTNFDILSNGFKLRNGTGSQNYSGRTYLYMAFAQNPFSANGGLAR